MEFSLKYIDPSYMIRSLPPTASDHVFCSFLGRHAVHAGMAGKTRLVRAVAESLGVDPAAIASPSSSQAAR